MHVIKSKTKKKPSKEEIIDLIYGMGDTNDGLHFLDGDGEDIYVIWSRRFVDNPYNATVDEIISFVVVDGSMESAFMVYDVDSVDDMVKFHMIDEYVGEIESVKFDDVQVVE